ncbi:uncharacterized protein [Lolium perenne]|uniref:uncharacterized protein isoform X2 n=1 Tax=Lolium perenne TaxID=4522 RepID=UPI0021F5EB58|nr:uncharacterized protein LOC127332630 isoform X2 [Lolium perenne]
MDPFEALIVRFHFGGEFIRVSNELQYVGGDESMSCIERAKLCFVQLKGHLSNHMNVKASMKYYYVTPGKELANGLLFLGDDISCKKMSDCTIDGRLAEVFVEYHGEEDEEESEKSGSDFQDEFETENDNEDGEISEPEVVLIADESNVIGEENILVPVVARVINSVVTSPAKTNMNRNSTSNSFQRSDKFGQGKSSQGVFSQGAMTSSSQVLNPNTQGGSQGHLLADHSGMADIVGGEYDSDSDDSDYVLPSDDSGEDDKTVQLRKFARMYKKKLKDSQRFVESKATCAVPIDLMANIEEVTEQQNIEAEYDSGSEDFSYDEASDGEGKFIRRRTKYARYDSNTEIPHFSLGMVFKSKIEFRKAVIKYGLKTYRNIKFMKSEDDRVRAKCAWPGCPWLIYGAISSRCSRFQIITYEDEHHCAPNRVNSLVSAKVIAKRYGHFILANPTWKISNMQCTVLKDFFADVSISKCKAAKKIVMDKLLSGLKEEYTKVFDYQLELLRSNPGSTIVVCLDPTIMEQNIFQRFYVSFEALKKGFKAGCRKVIGLDGCFFKGACQGELLCAIGRDANNQMYPVAWAVVEQETKENWEWFIGLLIKDLDINNDGDGWVFISDQQKGLIASMQNYLPRAQHRMCARHIYANWKKKHKCRNELNYALFSFP